MDITFHVPETSCISSRMERYHWNDLSVMGQGPSLYRVTLVQIAIFKKTARWASPCQTIPWLRTGETASLGVAFQLQKVDSCI